jgi:mRNA-degrading endonuclease RelE of RelBE toxin-antitoxin system
MTSQAFGLQVPVEGDVDGHASPYEGLHAARRGTYRVLYKIDESKHAIEIRSIRHRADAYRT